MRRFYSLLLLALLLNTGSFATVWYSAPAGGTANTLTNWWSTAGGTGTNPANFTTAGDVFTVQSSMTVTSGVTWTVTGSINMTSGYILGATNTINIGGSLTMSGTSYINSSSGAINMYIGGDFTMSGSSYITNSPSFTYIYLNNTSSTLASPQHISWTAGALGNWTYVYVNSGCVAQLTANSTWTASSYAFTVNGTLDCQTYSFTGASPFTLSSGATLITASTTGVDGAISTTGTKSLSTGANYTFNGTSAQTTGTSLPTALVSPSQLTINNTAGVTLSQSTTSTGTLSLVNGILNLGTNTLTLPGTAGAVSGASNTRYVKGTLQKTITGFSTVTFEVGDATYAPMTLALNATGTAGNFGVKANAGLHPQQASSGISSSAIVNHYWTITNNSAAGPTLVTPTATYLSGDIIGGSNTTFQTQKYTGTAWLGVALATTNTSTPNYTSTTNSGFALASVAGDYIFGTPVPTISGTPTSLAYGIVSVGSSAVQVFSVSATTLSPAAGSLTVTPTGPFLVSTTSATGPFTATASLSYTAGTVTNAPVWVQFNPAASTGYTNTVTVAGGTATSFVLNVTGTGAAACSGTPTPGTASMSPAGGNSSTAFTASLTGTTVAGGLTYQWQSASSGTGPWTNITGATSSSYAFSGLAASTYYQAVVTCPTYAAATSNTVSATFVAPAPGCTTPSWSSGGSYTYGSNGFALVAASGANLSDGALTSTPIVSTSNGYANRTGAFTPTILYKGGTYPASITWGTASGYQEAQIWIDFNDDGVFSATEEVTPVSPFSTGAPAQPTVLNVSIPASANLGIHLMRVRAIWESIGTTLGAAPAHLDPCAISYSGISLQYYSGTVLDYFVNIQTPPPSMTATPTSLSYAPTGVGLYSPAQTFALTGSYLLPASGSYTVTAPANFQVSSDGSTWVSSYSPSYTASTITPSPATVYVRFNPTAVAAYTGTVTVTGGGATVNVPVSGNGALACAGTPTAGTVVASATTGGCTSFTSNLSLSGSTVALNIAYQWQSSPDNSSWTNVTGATNNTYTATVSSAIYYRCNVTCTNSSITSSTAGIYLQPGPSYATLPFTETFEGAWQSICDTREAPTNYWRMSPTTGNQSWRRDDDGSAAAWGASSSYSYTPAGSTASGASSLHSARYHQGNISAGLQGSMLLYVALPVGNIQFSFDMIDNSSTTGTNNTMQLQYSTDNGVTYTNIGPARQGAFGWTTFTSTVNVTTASNAIVRFLGTADFGVNDIGIDNVNIVQLPTCSAPTAQATALTFTPAPALTSISGSFTAASPAPDKYLVVMTTSSVTPTAPVNGVTYAAGTAALGGTIVQNSSATTFTATGLTPGTQYWFWIYSNNSLCMGGPTPPLYLTTSPLTGNTSTPACSLSGTKVVGPTGDYVSLTAAMAAINTLGVSGPLALELQTTYSTSTETFPINITNATCVSATNTITIRPQGTLTISGTASPMFNLNGANYVTIDGRVGSTGTTKALTLTNTSTSGQVIQFINDASNNTVKYTTITGTNQNTASGNIVFSTTTGSTGSDYNTIDNCDLLDATTQPYNQIYASGTSGKENDHITISNCNIANFFAAASTSYGIYITTGNTQWTITNNRLYQTASRSFTSSQANKGIYINNTVSNANTITNNTIGYASNTGTGSYTTTSTSTSTFYAIHLSVGNATPSLVKGNTITAINFTGTSTSATTGGALCGISISSGSATIDSNTIGSLSATGALTATINTNTGGTIVGINASSSVPAVVNITNNRIGGFTLVNGSTTLGGGIQGIQVSSTAAFTVTGNTIGSTTTANSMNLSTVTTGTQLLYGINSAVTTTLINPPVISNNTIANMTAAGTGTANLTAGILHTGASTITISGNTIKNIASATTNTTIASGQLPVAGIAFTSGTTQAAGSTNAIIQNTINAISATNTGANIVNVAGISFSSGTSTAIANLIAQNDIYDLRNASTYVASATTPAKAIGLYLYSPSGIMNIYNNMISLGNSQTTPTSFVGIMNYSSVSNALNIYYNTVNIEGTAGSGIAHTACFNRGTMAGTSTTPVSIMNNIFNNARTGGTGKHYAIANGLGATGTNSGWGANASNYNILNSSSAATVGFWGNADQTLSAWQTASAGDGNSFSNTVGTATPNTPVFVNSANGDLHLNMGTTANNFEAHGTVISAITTDYDGQTRPGTTTVNGGGFAPDLGADEFDGNPNENIPPTITYSPVLGGCGAGDVSFSATIVDPSGVPTGTNKPQVYFKKGAAGTWYHSAGTLTSGTALSGVWTFTVSATTLGGVAVGDQIYYYVIAQDVPGNVGANPGAGLVATDVNTVTTPPTTPNTFNILNSMSGNYTVGAAGTYTTLTAAVNAYNAACLAGPVTFTLTDATYSTAETFPIVVTRNPYASTTNTLTIKSAAGTAVAVTGTTSSTSILKFLNAQYVTVDGLATGGASLTLTNNNTGTNAVVFLASTATTGPGNSNITIKNTNLVGGTNTTASSWAILAAQDNTTPATTSGYNNDNITVQNCTAIRTAYAIYANGTAGVSNGGLDNWTITGNAFGPSAYSATNNIAYNGLYLNNMVSPMISNNTFQFIGQTSTASQTAGIVLNGFVNGATITGNYIHDINAGSTLSTTGAPCGIAVGGTSTTSPVTNTTITKNIIRGVYGTTYGVKGIMLNPNSGSSNTLIANNQISDITGGGYFLTSIMYSNLGIDMENVAGGIKIYYNTINMNGSSAGYNAQTGVACIANNGSGGNIDIRDNILINTFSNTTVTNEINLGVYTGTAPGVAISNLDYNDYYITAPTGSAGYFGAYTSSNLYGTMAAYQAGFGGNTHNANVNATFASSTDLHLTVLGANYPITQGTPLSVTTDYDGTTRNATTPTMGINEVTIPVCTAANPGIIAQSSAICASGTTTLSLAGASGTYGITYQWKTSTDSVSWTNVGGATNATYTLPAPISSAVYYRAVVGCIYSGIIDSTARKIKVYALPTINATPATATICAGSSATIAATGGVSYVWAPSATLSSATTAVVTASPTVSTTYIVTGTDANGCTGTVNAVVSVTANPSAVTLTPTSATACSGSSTTLTAGATIAATAFAENFNSGIGAWNITNTSGTANSYFQWRTSPGYSSVAAGDGSAYVEAAPDATGSGITTNTILTSPSFSLAGYSSATLALNQYCYSSTSYDATVAIQYSIDGGTTWTNIANQLGSITGSTTWTVGTPNNTYTMPAATLGQSNVKIRFNYVSTWGFYWAVDNIVIAGAATPTMTWSPVAGLYTDAALTTPYSGTSATTVYAAPTTGTTASTVTYTATAANGTCTTSNASTITVNPTPAVTTGTTTICTGNSTTLSNTTSGGTWTSSNTAIATVGIGTGIVTGVATGTANISYTLATGCSRVMTITVNQSPAAIAGTFGVCTGQTTSLTDATSSGVWSSSSTANATVNPLGIVTGVAAGNATISYTTLNGCSATQLVTVGTTPAAIAGANTVCTGATTTLTDATGAGAWSSSTGSAIVGTAGNVTGVTAGTTTISYMVGTCAATKVITVNTSPAAITAAATTVCEGSTVTFTDATTGGTWSSSNANATVTTYGIVSGVTAGNSTITYTAANGCPATQALTINPAPSAISGVSVICQGSTATLTNTVSGGTWSSSAPATLSVSSGGIITGGIAGTATITYTLPAGCTATKTINVNGQPTIYTVTGGGGNCLGASGVHIGLNGSQYGYSYSVNGGSPTTGTGSAIDFGLFPVDGVYTVLATNTATTCSVAMTGSATVYTNPLPTAYNVTGGGAYCAGGAGVDAGVDVTDPGIYYILYNGTTVVDTVMGSGADISFGNQTNAGVYTVVAADAVTGCTQAQNGNATVIVNPLPIAYNVTGGGSACEGFGVTISLDGSETNASYTIYNAVTSAALDTVAGTGSAISFDPITVSGTYTVQAVNTNGCVNNMTASAVVVINPAPAVHTVTGGGSYCSGTGGMHIILDGSDMGINYQLYNGSAAVGAPVAGTGSAIDFGALTVDGTYSVRATNATTDCHSDMSGNANITTLALPVAYNVTGGGSYCAGGTGVDIQLDNSEIGTTYYLYNGSTLVTSISGAGAGIGIDFGMQTAAGTYTVFATNSNMCNNSMSGSASVVINPLPVVQNVTGGGHYCAGSGGIAVGVDNSEYGVTYTLYNGAAMVATVNGTGAAISFGNQTVDGTYTVLATSGAGCTQVMNGSTDVTTDPLPALHNVTGGGEYCSGSLGVHVGLDGSDMGINYQLYNGGTAVGGPMAGTGAALDWGVLYAGGTYSVMATNATLPTACAVAMSGSQTITQHPLPLVQNMTGGGAYCIGGAGVHVGIDNAETGVTYALYNGTTLVTTVTASTTGAIDFGLMTTAGAYNVVATSPYNCVNNMSGIAVVTVNSLPDVYYVTGGGNYCAGGIGVHVGLSNSTTGIEYYLYNGSTLVDSLPGTGLLLDYGLKTAAGTYSVMAVNTATTCSSNMTGVTDIIVNPLPMAYNVSGTGSYCAGGAGVAVSVDMTDLGYTYQLNNGTTNIGTAMMGTGSPITFPAQTAGTYVVIAENMTTHCTATMNGAAVITENPLPVVETVTGGGSYCAGGTGVHIGINPSQNGVNYTVSGGTAPVVVAGNGGALDFGAFTTAGTYTVTATDATTGCTNVMGTTSISINAQPVAYTVTGGGNYCVGGTGSHVTLTGSDAAFNYQLYVNGAVAGGTTTGTGASLDFGLQTTVGTYSVMATNTTGSCATPMTGAATIDTNSLPIAYAVTGGGSYCAGGTGVVISLPYSQVGVTYSAAGGAPVLGTGSAISLGTFTAAGTYTVLATNGYGCTRVMSGSATVVINPLVTPAVTVTAAGGATVCAGSVINLTANPVNGGTMPAYQWRVNGVDAGVSVNTYSYAPSNGDIVTAVLTSNATCATPDTAAGGITIAVVNNVTPAVTIAASSTDVCMGTAVTFSATDVNGGATPAFTWLVNGSIVSTGGASHTYVPANGDIVYAVMNSSLACVTTPVAYSNDIVMAVDSPYVPVVTVYALNGTRISAGQTDTLIATVTSAGAHPTFQWKVNGTIVAGVTTPYYITDTLHNNDSVTCVVTGTGACALTSFNTIHITLIPTDVTNVSNNNSDIRLMPNPNKGQFSVRGTIASVLNGEVSIDVTDMLGQTVYSGTAKVKNGNINEQIELSNALANGMYMLNIRSGSEHKVFHFVLEQ